MFIINNNVIITIIIIIITTIINIMSFVTVFAIVLFVRQRGANHAPEASVTQVNNSVHTLSRGGSRGRVQGVMTYGFLIQLVFCKKKLCGLSGC